ncbi:hypothetical protein QBC33DRAFT_523399 [Phialemonium atrogriseum]|uniref:Uncharacterized protein n=1 Tax=Phialemonium atrogriseum TaxID=1093897 RepID=A0AAJ0C9Z1_9PEZI|nr:uncharacterized protein QBC33DRAFT_523399 [Phialemonium atrogriseum]KAK1771349.1 hypothetical protein QBC33DRAFT_523399 [Phialemonium atrogriseum]
MPVSPASPAQPQTAEEARLKAALERNALKFHIKTKNAKWACTLQDRASYERQKGSRTSSSASVSTTESTSSTSSN